MIRSMTGFGRGVATAGPAQITIDIRSVNHRFLDVNLRSPKEYLPLEGDIRQAIKNRLSRGHVDVFVGRTTAPGKAGVLAIDEELAARFLRQARALAKRLGLAPDLRLEAILAQPGVVAFQEAPLDLDVERPAVMRALSAALRALAAMQATEGRALARDLSARLRALAGCRKRIETRLPELNAALADRLRARIGEMMQGMRVEEDRLAQEAAFLASRSDITEELVRLKSHLEQMVALLGAREPIGRKLDFLLQEANREVTTIGSKIGNSEVSALVVEMKAELEKVREQAQNVE